MRARRPSQGVLNATKAVATVLSLAKAHGAVLRDRTAVVAIDTSAKSAKGDPIVRLSTSQGRAARLSLVA
jgi:hypothetical protein